eukprot:scaffold271342_cov16-Tisochrysis_lutea.AAC.1
MALGKERALSRKLNLTMHRKYCSQNRSTAGGEWAVAGRWGRAYTQKWLYVQHTRSTAGRVRAVSRALGLAGAGWAVDSMDRFPVPACFWSHCHSPNGAQTCTKPVCDCASRCK